MLGPLSRRDFLRLAAPGVAALLLPAGCTTVLEKLQVQETPMINRSEPDLTPASRMQDTAEPIPTPSSAAGLPTGDAPSTLRATPDPIPLDVKIGQMLMVGFRGLEVDGEHFVVKDIRERNLGGVVLFDFDVPTQRPERNVVSPAQLKALVASLQVAAPIPLLVAIDHEGGMVTRLRPERGFPPTVSHHQLGERDDLEETYTAATDMAQTLAEAGTNLNLAPVVDLCANPDNPIIARYERCFSADPEIVTSHALRFILAHHEQGILCALKHFPGHGSSKEDSHRELVDITRTWSQEELLPYRRIIAAGQADAVMTAHVFHADLDPDYPATLSHPILTGVLREELGYGGVVISDDMQMAAIVDNYGFETAIQKAIEAGVDLLVFANNSVYEEDVARRAIEVIKQAVAAGTISQERIDASYARIRRLKSQLLV